MLDLLLDSGGDLWISENGDISLTESVCQSIRIRLKWFFGEWKYNPDFGVPYYEDILVKNPNEMQVEQLLREQIMSVEDVDEVQSVELTVDTRTRRAMVRFTTTISGEQMREEVLLDV